MILCFENIFFLPESYYFEPNCHLINYCYGLNQLVYSLLYNTKITMKKMSNHNGQGAGGGNKFLLISMYIIKPASKYSGYLIAKPAFLLAVSLPE